MNKQKKLDNIFMNTAEQFSTLSHCVSRKVGCVIVNDNRIIATGYNGTSVGMVNCDEIFIRYDEATERQFHTNWSDANEIHAEMNAILFCAKNGISINNSTVYTTIQPCQHCLKNMIQAGVKRILYKYPYDKAIFSGYIKKYMEDNNIILEQLTEEK